MALHLEVEGQRRKWRSKRTLKSEVMVECIVVGSRNGFMRLICTVDLRCPEDCH